MPRPEWVRMSVFDRRYCCPWCPAARYPVEERTRALPGVTCPVCDRVSLVFDPATPERETTQVNCSTRGCGVIYTEDEFRRLTRLVEWEHKHPSGAA